MHLPNSTAWYSEYLKCDLHCCETLKKEFNKPPVRRQLYFLIALLQVIR
jgi:hypothetical protein